MTAPGGERGACWRRCWACGWTCRVCLWAERGSGVSVSASVAGLLSPKPSPPYGRDQSDLLLLPGRNPNPASGGGRNPSHQAQPRQTSWGGPSQQKPDGGETTPRKMLKQSGTSLQAPQGHRGCPSLVPSTQAVRLHTSWLGVG